MPSSRDARTLCCTPSTITEKAASATSRPGYWPCASAKNAEPSLGVAVEEEPVVQVAVVPGVPHRARGLVERVLVARRDHGPKLIERDDPEVSRRM